MNEPPVTTEDLAKVAELDEKATPGPWREGTENVWQDAKLIPVVEMRHRHYYDAGTRHTPENDRVDWPQADAALIAEYRTLCPRLARELIDAREKQDRLTEMSMGAMQIAEGDEDWKRIPAECPMVEAVIKLRNDYEDAREKLKAAMEAIAGLLHWHGIDFTSLRKGRADLAEKAREFARAQLNTHQP